MTGAWGRPTGWRRCKPAEAAAGAFVVLGLLVPTAGISTAQAAPCDGVPASSAAGLNAVFSNPIGAWQAGDVPHRYALPDGRVLWVLNDSFLNDRAPGGAIAADSVFVHNVAIVQQGSCVRVVTGPRLAPSPGATPQPTSFLHDGETPTDWWWFHGGMVVGDELRVVVARMHRDGPVQWGIAFAPVDTWVATFDWRSLQLRSLAPAPDPGVPVYGFSLASDGAFTYLFGQQDELRHPAGSTVNTVARVPRGELAAARQYWDGATWQGDAGRAASVSTHGSWNHRMRVTFTGERWIGVVKEDEFFGNDALVFEAPEPQGPWALTMRVPAPAAIAGETVTYDAEPIVAPVGDRLTIAWSDNTLDFALAAARPELYRPRFADLALLPPLNSNPVCAGAPVGGAAPEALATIVPGPPSAYQPLVPARLADTRTSSRQPPVGGSVLTVDVARSVTAGAPAGTGAVAAALLNVTSTGSLAPGYVTVWPSGLDRPLASSLNADRAGATAANLVTVPVGPDGSVSLVSNVAMHLVVDLLGVYRAAPAAVSAGRLTALSPARLLDTRELPGGAARPAAGATIAVPVLGHGGVPASGVSSVVLTVTGTEAAADGFVTAWAGGARPATSNLNLARGATRANQAVVPVGADGMVRVFTQTGAHLVVDVAGWFGDDTAAPATAGRFVPVAPIRLLDSRAAAGRPAGGCTATVTLPLPPAATGAIAAVANLTTTETTRAGYVTAWPAGTDRPTASNLNADAAGQTRPVHAVVALGAGAFSVFQQHGGHLVVDLAGWYT